MYNFCLKRNSTTFEDLIAATRLGEMTRPSTTLANGVYNVQIESLTDGVPKLNEKISQLTIACLNKEQPEKHKSTCGSSPQQQKNFQLQNKNRLWPSRLEPN